EHPCSPLGYQDSTSPAERLAGLGTRLTHWITLALARSLGRAVRIVRFWHASRSSHRPWIADTPPPHFARDFGDCPSGARPTRSADSRESASFGIQRAK